MNIQEIILNMYKEIKIILDENNIKYYALGGTFLGAIRHKGFIPWDDDIDIGIKRGDYEKFIKIVSSKLPNNLKLNTYKNDKDHHYYFSRIIDKRYTVKRNGSIDERLENIWIDIFPLDGIPNNLIIRNLYKIKMLFIRFLYHLSCFNKINIKRPGRPLFDRIIIYIIKKLKIGKRLNTKKLLDKIDKNLKKYDYDNSKYVINFMGQYKFKEMFKKKYYDDVKKYKFEDTYIYGPSNYDKILSRMYGDYMTPPPENERNTHFIDK